MVIENFNYLKLFYLRFNVKINFKGSQNGSEFSRSSSGFGPIQPNKQIDPQNELDIAYYNLPAGLIVPLIKVYFIILKYFFL